MYMSAHVLSNLYPLEKRIACIYLYHKNMSKKKIYIYMYAYIYIYMYIYIFRVCWANVGTPLIQRMIL